MKKIKLFLLATAILMVATPSFTASALSLGSLGSSNGSSAGKALFGLYSQYKKDGKLDLTNPTNLSNIATLAKNIKGLSTQKKTTNFVSGLIKGSQNLVTTNNSGSILNSLKKLSTLDLNSLSQGKEKEEPTSLKDAATTAISTASAVSTLTALLKKFN